MQSDLEVRLGDIRRVFVGGAEVEIYVASGDAASPESAPVITFYRKLEGGDELIEKLARRLPPGAEIEHPSGELAGRLGGRT